VDLQPSSLEALLDWKRRIFALYAEIRATHQPQGAREHWRAVRDEMFKNHPQSPLGPDARTSFTGLDYFDYDEGLRVLADVKDAEPKTYEIATSGDGSYSFTKFGVAAFELEGRAAELELYWLDGYGGGVFLPFRDATGGTETYGAGRYLLDTIKGADLGWAEGKLVLDFNFAYNPSCAYDQRWVCPLAPPHNRIDIAVRAGERYENA
jgi:uncharacterized protein